MATDDRGALLREFPQTFSLKNWPFLALLAFLAIIPAYWGFAAGNLKAGLFVAAAILAVPAAMALVQALGGLLSTRVVSCWANGLLLHRRGRDVLVPWSSVRTVTLRRESVSVGGLPMAAQFVVGLEVEGRRLEIWPQREGAEAAVEIAERAGTKLEALD